jgi:uncharacterized membrane protein
VVDRASSDFVVHRKSRFVSFHALQVLFLQIAYLICIGAFMVLWFGIVFSFVLSHPGADQTALPPTLFIVMPIIWLGFMGLWGVVVLAAILYSIKAGRGEWANYPLFGKLSRRVLKLDSELTAS